MQILVLSNYYPPFERGGYEQLCRDVAMRLQERGHDLVVLTGEIGRSPADQQQEIPVFRLLQESPDFNSRLGVALQFFLQRKQVEQHNLDALRAVTQRYNPDLIFIWNIEGLPRSIAAEAERLPNTAVAYWLAGYTPAEPDEYWEYWHTAARSFLGRLLKRLFGGYALRQLRAEGKPLKPRMSHTAVVSQYMRDRGLQDGTLPPQTAVIYNGVELEDFYQPVRETSAPLKLLQAGRVSQDKGVHLAVQALHQLVHTFGLKELHLSIVGSGPPSYRLQLEQLIQRLDLAGHVTFLDQLPRAEIPHIMHNHDILLLPSIYPEAFARVVLEAMAAGLAVVAADIGGTDEIVLHEKTGLICRWNDAHSLAEQIQRLAQDPHLRQKLAQKGQQTVLDQFSLDKMVDQLDLFLTAALPERTKI